MNQIGHRWHDRDFPILLLSVLVLSTLRSLVVSGAEIETNTALGGGPEVASDKSNLVVRCGLTGRYKYPYRRETILKQEIHR
jgi:hypothetical protein